MLSILLIFIALMTRNAFAATWIVGGAETGQHEIRYEVAVLLFGELLCSGGIIEEQFVITAAHCVIDDENKFYGLPLTVMAGTNFLANSTSKQETGVRIKVIKAYVPIIFNGGRETPVGDIAVLKLEKKLDLGPSSKMSKLDLPPSTGKKLTNNNSYVNVTGVIAGFGWNKVRVKTIIVGNHIKRVEIGSTDGHLLKAKALIVSNQECQRSLTNTVIHVNQLCAKIIQHPKNIHQGVCSGDSGSPLVYKNIAVGTVSFNFVGCNDGKRPAVYTRVSSFINFIQNAINDKVTNDIRFIKF